jgi:hypothetical protein
LGDGKRVPNFGRKKKLLGGTRRRGEDNIKIYLKELKFESIYGFMCLRMGSSDRLL